MASHSFWIFFAKFEKDEEIKVQRRSKDCTSQPLRGAKHFLLANLPSDPEVKTNVMSLLANKNEPPGKDLVALQIIIKSEENEILASYQRKVNHSNWRPI